VQYLAPRSTAGATQTLQSLFLICVSGEVFLVGAGVSAPTVLFRVAPEYSEEARNAKYSGTVLLAITVET
jgi:hypothetical protein